MLYDLAPHLPYGLSAALFAFAAACLFTIGPLPDRVEPGKPIRRMVDGLAYVRRNRSNTLLCTHLLIQLTLATRNGGGVG